MANIEKEVEKLDNNIKKLKEQRKELLERYTFKGLYSKVAGRKNILSNVRDSDMKDTEKYVEAVKVLKEFVQELEDVSEEEE